MQTFKRNVVAPFNTLLCIQESYANAVNADKLSSLTSQISAACSFGSDSCTGVEMFTGAALFGFTQSVENGMAGFLHTSFL